MEFNSPKIKKINEIIKKVQLHHHRAHQALLEIKVWEKLDCEAFEDFEKIKNHPLLSVIGHVVEKNAGCQLITGLGHQIELTAQGWQSFENK